MPSERAIAIDVATTAARAIKNVRSMRIVRSLDSLNDGNAYTRRLLEPYRSPCFEEASGEESMSEDPDLPKASYALQVLRQARLSRNKTAAIMVGDLVYEMASTGLRTPEIEEARQAAWAAISAFGERSQKRRVCWAHVLESSAQSDRELDRIVDLRSGDRCARKRPTPAGLRGANLHAE